MKIICWRFPIKILFTFWDICTWDMWKVCLQTLRNNRICQKLAYFLKNLQTSGANISRILRIKIAKFSGYSFYMNTSIYGDFQICISAPLISTNALATKRLTRIGTVATMTKEPDQSKLPRRSKFPHFTVTYIESMKYYLVW